jgi:hypothetical protein
MRAVMKLVLLALIASLFLGCVQEQVRQTPIETPIGEEKEVTQIEDSIDEVENILNDLQELDNISFDI